MAFRLNQALGLIARYLTMAAAMRREGMGITVGFASAAQRCPDRPGLVDELGTLTWRQLDERIDVLAAALQPLPGQAGTPRVIGIMCRNHRGFVEALMAANRIGSDVLLLNTSFAGPALADKPEATRIVAWTDGQHELTVAKLITEHAGLGAQRTGRKSKMILLTSGTTGMPKGAKQSGGGARIGTLKAILDRTPWRAEERHLATGLALVPVMFDRIMDLAAEVRNRYSGRSLRFAAASGSRMRPDVVIAFTDDEMIVSGGENVYPIEVEKTLAAHPEVAEAAVIVVDDEQYGQRPAAFVVLESRRPAKSPSWTNCRVAAPARSCAPNCNRRSAANETA
jgi:acyl-CoA synthetase (AMP-forming)/AMP-acid ligase II